MANLMFRIHHRDGHLVAATEFAEDAAAVVATHGEGTTIRVRKRIVYRDGVDGDAAQSYDQVADVVWRRVNGAPNV